MIYIIKCKVEKKCLTETAWCDNLYELSLRQQKKNKKVLDKQNKLWYNVEAVTWKEQQTKNLDNWTIDNKSLKISLREDFKAKIALV